MSGAARGEGPGGFRILEERTVHDGHVVSLCVGAFAAPDGTRFEREVVHHPGAVSVVPLLDDGRVVMVRQFRAAVGRLLLEIPAGKRDVAGEQPTETAHRELEEEVGWRAGRLDLLGEFYNSPGFSDEYSFVYLGRDLTRTQVAADGIEEQHLSLELVPLGEVAERIAGRSIVDAKSVIGLLLARELLAREAGAR